VTTLGTIFKGEPEQPAQETDKLVDLFRNRSELKKEFAALRNEKFRLQDRVKQQQGATARVQQKLDHLESLLLDPEWVHNVAVHFQLRRLGLRCRTQLEGFAEQLKQQRERRSYDKVLERWQSRQSSEVARIEAEIGERRMRLQLAEDQLQAERHRLSTMSSVTRLVRGKEQQAKIDDIEKLVEHVRAKETALLGELENIHGKTPPDPEGLDTEAKRAINYKILAFAQQLYLHYSEDDLAGMIREAVQKSVGAINYGKRKQCAEVLSLIERHEAGFDLTDGLVELLQRRAKMIAEGAVFRGNDDPVPVPASVATLFDIDQNGVVRSSDVNLLGENYFGLANVLSR